MSALTEQYKNLLTGLSHNYNNEYENIKPEDMELIESESSKLLHHMCKDEFVSTNIHRGDWYKFNGKIWQKEHSEQLIEKFTSTIESILSSDSEECFQFCVELLLDEDTLEEILILCNSLFYDKNFIENLHNNNLIGFENGVYDIHTKEFRQHRREDFLILSTHTNYEPSLHSDKLLHDLLFEHNNHEVFYNLIDNSSVIEKIKNALGDYFLEIDNSTYLRNFCIVNQVTALPFNLIGRRFVLVKNVTSTIDSSIVKLLASGDILTFRHSARLFVGIFKGRLCFENASEYLDTNDAGLMRRYRELTSV